MVRRLYALLAGVFAIALLLGFGPTAARAGENWPDVIDLPNGWLPEGVVTGNGPIIYSGSRANGAIYAANLRTGEGSILVPGEAGRVAVGLSFDARSGYLFVAGGATGKAYVYNTRSGALVREYQLSAPGGFVNDVIVTRDAAYFTQSARPEYYRVPLGPAGRLAAPGDVATIALSADWRQVAGFNGNGIEASANGKSLIIVNSTVGAIYRVEPLTGSATQIDLNGASVSNGDGLLLQGNTLYVVRNRLNEIAVIALAPDLSSGTVVDTITNPNFDVPTTIAAFGNSIYAVNGRFTTPPQPTTPYTIVRFSARP